MIGHNSSTNLAKISSNDAWIRKEIEIDAKIKLLACSQESNFTKDLCKTLCDVMVTKRIIGHIYELGRDIIELDLNPKRNWNQRKNKTSSVFKIRILL